MLSLCWGAMASLWHFHGVKKHITPRKVFGVFDHKISSKDRMLVQATDDRSSSCRSLPCAGDP